MTDASPPGSGLRSVIEDHALHPVPAAQRRSGWNLLANTAGVGTTLVVLGVGSSVTFTAGTKWGLAMGVLATILASVLGWAVGRVCQVTGTSSTVTSRFYGLGANGSSLASLIFAFMILGFLALENALLYYGTIFMFGWKPTTANAIGIYAVLTVLWILLTTFGMGLVQKVSLLLTIVTGVLFAVVTVIALARSSTTIGDIWNYAPPHVGFAEVTGGLSAVAGIAGALALVGADFSRYARTSRDVKILATGGAVVVNFLVVLVGTLVFQAGNTLVATYLARPAHSAQAASLSGTTVPAKIAFMAAANPGAYFIVLAGFLGFAVMYAAQAKAQVLNTYSGSLALSNLADAAFGRSPGRFFMVVIGNVIALLAIWANILSEISKFLGALGILTTSLCVLMIVDYFVIRRGLSVQSGQVERFNWAGIIALVLSSAIAYEMQAHGVTNLGFLIAMVLTAAIYTGLRRTVFAEGTATSTVDLATALHDSDAEAEATA